MNKKIVTYRGDPLEEIDNSGTIRISIKILKFII